MTVSFSFTPTYHPQRHPTIKTTRRRSTGRIPTDLTFKTQIAFHVRISSALALGGNEDDIVVDRLTTRKAASFIESSFSAVEKMRDLRATSWIVLVDDEESIRTAVGQLFVDRGYQYVSTCEGGVEALAVALSGGRPPQAMVECDGVPAYDPILQNGGGVPRIPSCIISDIRMPGMDGLELLQRIRKDPILSHVPVVLLTAKGLTQDRIAGYDSGADAYLSKPFAPDELVAIVDNIIERYDLVHSGGDDGTTPENTVQVDDLKRDLDEIKNLLLNKGGGGVGNGWVEQTNVFLSKDEQEVLELLSQGLMTKEIAARTYLSTRRIEQLLTRMFRKTGSRNRTELVRWAVSTGNVE
jgi:DNA-binding NarL/FixJ family response regulator